MPYKYKEFRAEIENKRSSFLTGGSMLPSNPLPAPAGITLTFSNDEMEAKWAIFQIIASDPTEPEI